MQEYRRKAACTLLLYRKVGAEYSSMREEVRGEKFSALAEREVLRDVSARIALHPSRLERRAMTGFFCCTHF